MFWMVESSRFFLGILVEVICGKGRRVLVVLRSNFLVGRIVTIDFLNCRVVRVIFVYIFRDFFWYILCIRAFLSRFFSFFGFIFFILYAGVRIYIFLIFYFNYTELFMIFRYV